MLLICKILNSIKLNSNKEASSFSSVRSFRLFDADLVLILYEKVLAWFSLLSHVLSALNYRANNFTGGVFMNSYV